MDSFKGILDHPHRDRMVEVMQKYINWGDPRDQYITDRKVFKKSLKEKELLYNLKLRNKEARKKHYGKEYKKYLNIPEFQINIVKDGEV